ncbi:hypothetical protein CFP56_035492 [Quercus suber]|uniref:Uncharacterized protein n=1 Tax=Quercus suber TaxID=58331 RepID=A0AAW0LQB4_QUESU
MGGKHRPEKQQRLGTFRIASWHGIQVAVKTLGEEVFSDDDKHCAKHLKGHLSKKGKKKNTKLKEKMAVLQPLLQQSWQ